jgi:putative peptidoglycan lipid II flippase
MTTDSAGAGLLRSSRAMAIGTILSRVTGLIRTMLLAAVIGTFAVGDAFNVANTLPNIVYDLLLGGVLTSVLVPLLVRAQTGSADDGVDYANRLLSAIVVALGAVTVVMVVAAPVLARLYIHSAHPGEVALATTFARDLLPQIFFYGVGATLGAILNTRGSFAAPMWAPILNNVVAIATLAVLWTTHPSDAHLTSAQTTLLGVGTTLGIVVQTLALLPPMRAVRFRLRFTTRLRGIGLAAALRLAAWTVVYVAASQAAFFVVSRLTTSSVPGFTVYTLAFVLFSLPHAVVAVSVISALLPQMSRHAAEGRPADVARDLARGTRLAVTVVLPTALLMVTLHDPIARLLFGYGHSREDAPAIGVTLAFFAIGLVPFSAYQLQLRAFYALADTRTPALISLVVAAVTIAADLVLYAVLPVGHRVYGLAAGYSLAYVVGWVVSTRALRRRLGRLGTGETVRLLVRLAIAAGLGAVVAGLLAAAATHALGHRFTGSLTAVVAGSAVTVVALVAVGRRLRIAELTDLAAVVRRRASP